MDQTDAEVLTCRICLDESPRSALIAPCLCSGSSKWIHRSCLDRWRTTREDKAFSKCTECLYKYQLVCLSGEDTARSNIIRQIRFCCYVIRDLLVALFMTQVVIMFFGLIAYSCDMKDHNLEKAFHFENHPMLFYYLVGLVVVLAMIGMSYSCVTNNNCNQNFSGPCFCDCPCCYVGPTDPVPICPNCNCAGIHCADCACCNSCDGAGCAACDCSALGAEAAVFLFAIIAIFAFIGLFVSIFAGIFFTQYIVRKHLHFLNKRTMAEDYIVKDLAPDALEIVRCNGIVKDTEISSFNPISTTHDSQLYNRLDGIEMGEIMNRDLDEEVSEPSAPTLTRDQEQVLIRQGLL